MVQHDLATILPHPRWWRRRPLTPQDPLDGLAQERRVLRVRHEAVGHGNVKDARVPLVVEAEVHGPIDVRHGQRVVVSRARAAGEERRVGRPSRRGDDEGRCQHRSVGQLECIPRDGFHGRVVVDVKPTCSVRGDEVRA